MNQRLEESIIKYFNPRWLIPATIIVAQINIGLSLYELTIDPKQDTVGLEKCVPKAPVSDKIKSSTFNPKAEGYDVKRQIVDTIYFRGVPVYIYEKPGPRIE